MEEKYYLVFLPLEVVFSRFFIVKFASSNLCSINHGAFLSALYSNELLLMNEWKWKKWMSLENVLYIFFIHFLSVRPLPYSFEKFWAFHQPISETSCDKMPVLNKFSFGRAEVGERQLIKRVCFFPLLQYKIKFFDKCPATSDAF